MELDTNIMQTKTVGAIVEVLKDINEEILLSASTKEQILIILKKHQRSMSLIGSHQR
jgi:mannitol/fructose-specific phosphotransferase system IIA component (Ntr-type)